MVFTNKFIMKKPLKQVELADLINGVKEKLQKNLSNKTEKRIVKVPIVLAT